MSPLRQSGSAGIGVYRYDGQGRLQLVRNLFSSDNGQLLAYHADGSVVQQAITASLGAAVAWQGAGATDQWSGVLDASPVNLSFVVRDSELSSTVKTPGAQGAIVIAVEVDNGGASLALQAEGATLLGSSTRGAKTVFLLRVTQAQTYLLQLTGSSAAAQVHVSVAGDLNDDGRIDGADSAAFEQALQGGDLAQGDLDGDGSVGASDRQLLYANYGWRANQAPVVQTEALQTGIKTHSNLAVSGRLDHVAADNEGDRLFWRLVGSTHGTARISGDGATIDFTPDADFAGEATITVQADDGFASTAPVTLHINVSGAALLRLRAPVIGFLMNGQSVQLQAVADFEDEQGVVVSGTYLSYASTDAGVASVDRYGYVHAGVDGVAVVTATVKGLTAASTATVSGNPLFGDMMSAGLDAGFDVYPGSVTLVDGTGQRQIRINGATGDQSGATHGTRYFVENPNVATVTADGLILAHGIGSTTVSVVWQGLQKNIEVRVEALPAEGAQSFKAGEGGLVNGGGGLVLQIGEGALEADTTVSIHALAEDALPLAMPQTGEFLMCGAFTLDVGASGLGVPAQIQMAAPAGAVAGDLVFFYKYTTFLDENDIEQKVWLAVESGRVGSDGFIHTSSPPYDGVSESGIYTVAVRKYNDEDGSAKVYPSTAIMMVNFATSMALASTGLVGAMVGIELLAIGVCSTLTMYSMSIGRTYKSQVALPTANASQVKIVVGQDFLNLPTESSFPAPKISGIDFDGSAGGLVIQGSDLQAFDQQGRPVGRLVARLIGEGGQTRDFETIVSGNQVQLVMPATQPLAGYQIELVRIIASRTITPSGAVVQAGTEVVGNSARIKGRTSLSAVVLARSIVLMQNGAQIAEITTDDKGQALDLFGWRVDPMSFSGDNGRLYVASRSGRVYVIDTASLKIFATLQIPGATDGTGITSLTLAGDGLYVAVGNRWGVAGVAGGGALYRFDADPLSPQFGKPDGVLQLKTPNLFGAPYGFYDLAAAGGGRYLVVTMPNARYDLFGWSGGRDAGDLLVLDLKSLDAEGNVNVRRVSGSGITPMYIEAGGDQTHLIVSSEKSFNRGVSTVALDLDATSGDLNGATWSGPISMSPADGYTSKKYWQVINEAAGVVVTPDQKYAFVSDYNLQRVKLGGDIDIYNYIALKVMGGKVGVIKDPFSSHPVFLGATSPIEEGSLGSLALSADGKTLYAGLTKWEGKSGLLAYNVTNLINWAEQDYQAGTTGRLPIDGEVLGRAARDVPTRYGLGWVYGVETQRNASIDLLKPKDIDSYTDASKLLLPTLSWTVEDSSYIPGSKVPQAKLYISSRQTAEALGLIPGGAADVNGQQESTLLGDLFNALPMVGTDPTVRDSFAGRTLTVLVDGKYDDSTGKITYSYTIPAKAALTASQTYHWAVQYATAQDGQLLDAVGRFDTPSLRAAAGSYASVTLVTHGYQPPNAPGAADQSSSYTIASNLARLTGGGLFIYDPATGKWMPREGSLATPQEYQAQGKPIFLVSDWYEQSGLSTTGFAEAAADAIFASLWQLNADGGLNRAPLHIIGHSRGTVVSSELAQRLGLFGIKPTDLQVSLLDVHDFNQPSLNLGKLINDDFADPDAVYWQNVSFLDNYYERQASEVQQALTFNPNGRSLYKTDAQPLLGSPRLSTANIDMSLDDLPGFRGFSDGIGSGLGALQAGPHGRVQDWYAGTAALDIPTIDKASKKPIWRNFTETKSYAGTYLPGSTPNYTPWYVSREQDLKTRTDLSALLTQISTTLTNGQPQTVSLEGGGEGWFYSVLGGGYSVRPPLPAEAPASSKIAVTNDLPERPVVGDIGFQLFDGNFQASSNGYFGRYLQTYDVPGWSIDNGEPAHPADQRSTRSQFLNLRPNFSGAAYFEYQKTSGIDQAKAIIAQVFPTVKDIDTKFADVKNAAAAAFDSIMSIVGSGLRCCAGQVRRRPSATRSTRCR